MAFTNYTTDQLSAMKFYLGYGNLTILARPYFDIAAVFETVVQNNTDNYGGTKVINIILPQLEQIDLDIFNCRTRFAADKVSAVTRNPREMQDLVDQREFWIDQLSITTKVPRAPAPGGVGSQSVEVT